MVDPVSASGGNQAVATQIIRNENVQARPLTREENQVSERPDENELNLRRVIRQIVERLGGEGVRRILSDDDGTSANRGETLQRIRERLGDDALRRIVSSEGSIDFEALEGAVRDRIGELLGQRLAEKFGDNLSRLLNSEGEIDIDALRNVLEQQSEAFTNLAGKPSIDDVIAEALSSAFRGPEQPLIEIDA